MVVQPRGFNGSALMVVVGICGSRPDQPQVQSPSNAEANTEKKKQKKNVMFAVLVCAYSVVMMPLVPFSGVFLCCFFVVAELNEVEWNYDINFGHGYIMNFYMPVSPTET